MDQPGQPSDEARAAFRRALTWHIEASGRTREDLARAIGYESGTTITNWESGRALPRNPYQIFALEALLGTAPGDLSQFLGYVPTDVEHRCSVIAAVADDDRLDDRGKEQVVIAYLGWRQDGRG